ncbi:MAG: ABC transporter permease [Planctomycetes bacterium]|nr:ABC transporter permease [Planctomycetota bacterium]
MTPGALARRLAHVAPLLALLAALSWPLAYAVWISFTPGDLLEAPDGPGRWSLRWYVTFFSRPEWRAALGTSLAVGLLSAALATLAGGGLAVAVARHRFRGRRLLAAGVLAPLFVPGVVLGMALLPLVRALGLWGTLTSLAAAHALWSMPVVFLVARGALDEVDPDLERAARGLGASPAQVLRRVTLPLVLPALLVGALLAFVVSLNELYMALFLATPATETLPKVIWPNLRYTLTPLVAAASGVSLAVTAGALVAALCAARLVRRLRGARADDRARTHSPRADDRARTSTHEGEERWTAAASP